MEGSSEGWLRGAALINGNSDGIDVGNSVKDGDSLGIKFG